MTENRIEVNGMRMWAHHGCMDEEAIIGQEYRIDVTIWATLGPSAASDDLNETVDYVDVHRIVKREMDVRSKLVEQVCDRIVKGLRAELSLAERVEVKVTKFQPPIGGDCDHISVVMQA
jgi:dihydroneopterin aldolase